MSRVLLLDTGVLAMVTLPRMNAEIADWWKHKLRLGIVRVPEIADYELRRWLLLKVVKSGEREGLVRLDEVVRVAKYVPLTTRMMRKAADYWAEAHARGMPTASRYALDDDVILAAQAAIIRETGDDVVIATKNVRHLSRYQHIDARRWEEID